jgi:hypothetical protein
MSTDMMMLRFSCLGWVKCALAPNQVTANFVSRNSQDHNVGGIAEGGTGAYGVWYRTSEIVV